MARDKRNERLPDHFTMMRRGVMDSDAWRALLPYAQALYPWLRLEWKGEKANNNGKLRLSVRQASERMGCGINTASRAFHDLQAKGFIVVTENARLGIGGNAQSPAYEMTEIALPHGTERGGRNLYRLWQDGNDYPVHKPLTNNPLGKRGNLEPCHHYGDGTVTKLVTVRQ